jgi:hypothetical protein
VDFHDLRRKTHLVIWNDEVTRIIQRFIEEKWDRIKHFAYLKNSALEDPPRKHIIMIDFYLSFTLPHPKWTMVFRG